MNQFTFRLLFLMNVVLSTTPIPAYSQQSDLNPIVNSFYPDSRLRPAQPEDRRSCFDVLSKSPSGDPLLIIAGYTDGFSAVMRAIGKASAGDFTVVYETPTTVKLIGVTCQVELVDFDADGQLDVLLTLDAMKGSDSWAFKWSGTELIDLTPTFEDSGVQRSSLISATPIDVNRDGSLQILTAPGYVPTQPGEPMDLAYEVFKLETTHFEHQMYVTFYGKFQITATPELNVHYFVLPQDATQPYNIKIMNGDRLGGIVLLALRSV